MARQVALYGAVGGVLIALLKVLEYKHFVREYPSVLRSKREGMIAGDVTT